MTMPFFIVYLHRVRGIDLTVAGFALATIADEDRSHHERDVQRLATNRNEEIKRLASNKSEDVQRRSRATRTRTTRSAV